MALNVESISASFRKDVDRNLKSFADSPEKVWSFLGNDGDPYDLLVALKQIVSAKVKTKAETSLEKNNLRIKGQQATLVLLGILPSPDLSVPNRDKAYEVLGDVGARFPEDADKTFAFLLKQEPKNFMDRGETLVKSIGKIGTKDKSYAIQAAHFLCDLAQTEIPARLALAIARIAGSLGAAQPACAGIAFEVLAVTMNSKSGDRQTRFASAAAAEQIGSSSDLARHGAVVFLEKQSQGSGFKESRDSSALSLQKLKDQRVAPQETHEARKKCVADSHDHT